MGMAASQARLLSLQARQSNLEYQGQQINQARSVLSQQCTALYNSLLDMTVPTPPVTTDYQTINYKGTKGADKFSLGTVTPKSDGTYNVEMKYSMNGNCLKGGTQLHVTSYNEPEYLTGKYISGNETFDIPITTTKFLNPADDGDGDGEINVDEIKAGVTSGGTKLTDDTKVMHRIIMEPDDYDGKYYYKDTVTGKFVETDSFEEAQNGENRDGNVFMATTLGNIKNLFDDGGVYDSIGLDYLYEGNPENPQVETTGGFTLEQFQEQTFYDKDGKKITEDQLVKKGDKYEFSDKIAKPILMYQYGGTDEIKNPKYDPDAAEKGASIGGYSPQEFSEEVLGTSYQSAIQAVVNSYPQYKDKDGKPNISEIKNNFKVFFKPNNAGDLIPYFVKTEDFNRKAEMSSANKQAQVEVFSFEPNGTYTESKTEEGVKLYFDGNGRITSMDIPVEGKDGSITYETISLEMETVVDEAAYKDAMAQYEYEQYLYDQKQKEINAKTEIIQQEDRNLELKLQRLDNERTQITTEIEAVEKVIKENTEKSYKTFNA